MSNECPDERRLERMESRLLSTEERLRTIENAAIETRSFIHNQDRLNSKIEEAFDSHHDTLYGKGEQPGIVAHVANLRETQANWKKHVVTIWGAMVTAIVGGLATFFGSKH